MAHLTGSATDRASAMAARCAQATPHGETWQACCPSHEDTHPSLTITPTADKVLVHCHAGCTVQAIVEALGIPINDLFLSQTTSRTNDHKRIVQVYDYYDAQGHLLHQTVRYVPKAFRQRRPDPARTGAYIWNLQGIEPVLYRLPQVLAAVQRGETIYVVEGEKDADLLGNGGIPATCNAMGAGKWRSSYTETLRGAHVVIVPDNDAPGLEHAELVAASLYGVAASVKIAHLPDLPEHGDVTDWLNTGMTIQDLQAHMRLTPAWTPHDMPRHRNGSTPGPGPTDPYACPELPATAKVDEERAAEASIFLDDYIAFSKQWAPRAYDGFHEATGLFTLSTTGARRIKIEFGPHGVYTSLYLALAARTSLFTKTTAVDIALELLHRAELQALLADDDATPQAFLRSLTLYVPPDYGELSAEDQEAIKARLAFAGQKGWFYEEWGQHLHAMMQKEGQMAAFRSILRRLDDHRDDYVYASISRGRDVLIKPYVALLANVTPADLKPFLRAQSPLWRDGYMARMAFIAPGAVPASTAAFPEGAMTIPRSLITSLTSWHKRLGIPRVTLEPILDAKKKPTGHYRPVLVQPHKATTYVLSPDVRKAFYAYDEALHTLMAQSKQEDLDGSYARFPMKALRIAGLLASLHDDSGRATIWPAQWYRGQQIAERWRQDLHKLVKQVSEEETVTRASKGEERVLAVLHKHGVLSPVELHRWTKLPYTEIMHYLRVLQKAGAVREQDTGRTKKYSLVGQPRGQEK